MNYLQKVLLLSSAGILIVLSGCKKNENPASATDSQLLDVKVKVTFQSDKKAGSSVYDYVMTGQTPDEYSIALKKAVLVGKNGTQDFVLFDQPDLQSSYTFDFMDESVFHSLVKGTAIPEGEYQALTLYVYYLQMKIPISTTQRGVEKRNVRIYLSDDVETENGTHQPGDVVQIDDQGEETGWIFGEGQSANFDPITPRWRAYTQNGDGVTWLDFAGKSGKDFGPFGDVDFWNQSPQPVWYVNADFNFTQTGGNTLVVDLNVHNCWQFEDRNNDGNFGPMDISETPYPTKWQMDLPDLTLSQE
jgi:hypothetical protein